MSETLWKPSKIFIENSNLINYLEWLKNHKDLSFKSYDDLWQWSVDHHEAFWESLWQFFNIVSHSDYTEVCSDDDMQNTQWFQGATLNYAEHIFRNFEENKTAIYFFNETICQSVSWADLQNQVSAFQKYLIEQGISKGDRVCAYMPNIPETIVAFLAVNSLGAIWSCCSPDFGVDTVIERFEQIEPKLLIACNGYTYNGKIYKKADQLKSLVGKLPSVEKVVLVSYIDAAINDLSFDGWDSIIERELKDYQLSFTPVAFNHPIWILFSSGTTGKPKAITHSHGGMLLEHLKYMCFHNDVKKDENFFWFTTTGWMMWNFLQASMLVGATPVLYDGSPGLDKLKVLWQITEDLPIHHFGTSAPYLIACMKQGLFPKQHFKLNKLRSIGSTGAPLPAEAFHWVYSAVSDDLWLCSMSGGTDVCTAFVGGIPFKEVKTGRIQGRALGCALYAYDEDGNKITGSLGEMVIEKPMPSMPVYFWNDKDGERYHNSYFNKFEGKWCHGDWISIFEDGSLTIHGRSDATLNRKGVRIGTAEIYSVLDKFNEVKDSIIINIELPNGEDYMPLFVAMEDEGLLDETLVMEIKASLKADCSPRHVPDRIFQVGDIPYTLSGKKMEVPLKKIFMNMDVSKIMNKDAMRNPDSLDDFIAIRDQII